MTVMGKEYRTYTYRPLPRRRWRVRKLNAICAASRYAWNQLLADQQTLHGIAKEWGSKAPSPTYFTLGKAFTQMRGIAPWLASEPHAAVKYTSAGRLAKAYKGFFKGVRDFPEFKKSFRSFDVPGGNVRLGDKSVRLPGLGWIPARIRPIEGLAKICDATVYKELGKWYIAVRVEVDAKAPHAEDGALGVDFNCGQVTDSDGVLYALLTRLLRKEIGRRRHQRKMARRQRGSNRYARARAAYAKASRGIRMLRKDWAHQTSRALVNKRFYICIEDLNVKGMTKANRGLAREILNTAWGELRRMLEYKAGKVVAVNAAYTSQECHKCGHTEKANRPSQARFNCKACGYEGNADHNAARNILARGIGAVMDVEGSPLGVPVKRQHDVPMTI